MPQGNPVPGAVAGGPDPGAQGDNTPLICNGGRIADAKPQGLVAAPMDMIMQTDGTMKPEHRRGNYINASPGPGRSGKGFSAKAMQSKLKLRY